MDRQNPHKLAPTQLHAEIQRFHNNQIKQRSKDERDSFSPKVYRSTSARGEPTQDQQLNAATINNSGVGTIETTKKLNTDRNIVEEYRRKVKAKLSEQVTHHQQNFSVQTNIDPRVSSGFAVTAHQPSGLSTLNHSHYNHLRLSPPREQDLYSYKHQVYEPESIVQEPFPRESTMNNVLYAPNLHEEPIQQNSRQQQQFEPLRSRYSDHVAAVNRSNQRSGSRQSAGASPITVQQEQAYKPTSSFVDNNQLQYASNPLQGSSNALKMSDSSMQSVYNRIQNLRKTIMSQETVQSMPVFTHEPQAQLQKTEIQPYRATPSPKPQIIDYNNQVQQTLQVELSPQMHSIGDSASLTGTQNRRSIGYEGSSLEHKRKRSHQYNSLENDLEQRLRTEMEAKFQEKLMKLQEENQQKKDLQYQELLQKFNNLLFQFNQVSKQVLNSQIKQSQSSQSQSHVISQSRNKSQSNQQQSRHSNKDIESSFAQQQPSAHQENIKIKPKSIQSDDEKVLNQNTVRSSSLVKIQSLVSLGLPKSASSRSHKSSSICPIRSRNELFTMQDVFANQETEQKNISTSIKKTPKDKHAQSLKKPPTNLHQKQFKYKGTEKPDLHRIDFPSLDKLNYFAHKKSQQEQQEKMKDKSAFKMKRLIANLQKQIEGLQSDKSKLQDQVAELKDRVLKDGGQACCCIELKDIHDTERGKMQTIVDMWRQKACATAEHYQRQISDVKNEFAQMSRDCHTQIEKLQENQMYTMNMIINKQQTLELEYHRKLQKSEKENRQLNRRVVEHRHALVQQRLNDL